LELALAFPVDVRFGGHKQTSTELRVTGKRTFLLPGEFSRTFEGVGGGQIYGQIRLRTGGPGSHAKFSSFLRRKTHLKLRPRVTDLLFGSSANSSASAIRAV
jgi:hypothetical protein